MKNTIENIMKHHTIGILIFVAAAITFVAGQQSRENSRRAANATVCAALLVSDAGKRYRSAIRNPGDKRSRARWVNYQRGLGVLCTKIG